MSYTYSQKKRGGAAARKDGRASPPAPDALRSGAVRPTSEQPGRRVDLPDAMRSKMENAFGADLSAVKLYESEAVADAGARAVTQGSSIAFAPGMLDFTSYGGQALLGHELSHVVSQARGEVTGGGFLNDHALEARADREGAMAAAGQQVAMPTAALSSATAESAAGPMQAKKNKDKDEDPKKPPKEVSFRNFEGKKESGMGRKSHAVAKVKAGRNKSAYVKLGTDVDREMALADYYNMAGKTFDEKHQGAWSFDAPEVRGLSPAERTKAKKKKLIGTGKRQLHSPSTSDTTEEQELDSATVFAASNGRSLDYVDPNDGSTLDPYIKGDGIKDGKRVGDEKEQGDYRRMMGYISMLDMVTGNRDRIYGTTNPDNWLEEQDQRKAHLIDNDYTAEGTLANAIDKQEDRSAWMSRFIKMVGNGANETDPDAPYANFIAHSTDENTNGNAPTAKAVLGNGTYSKAGAKDAVEDMPAMREALEKQFRENGGGKLNAAQDELLQRMQITNEYMTNKDMVPIYQELAEIGFKSKGEDDPDNARRADLLRQLEALRAAGKKKKE